MQLGTSGSDSFALGQGQSDCGDRHLPNSSDDCVLRDRRQIERQYVVRSLQLSTGAVSDSVQQTETASTEAQIAQYQLEVNRARAAHRRIRRQEDRKIHELHRLQRIKQQLVDVFGSSDITKYRQIYAQTLAGVEEAKARNMELHRLLGQLSMLNGTDSPVHLHEYDECMVSSFCSMAAQNKLLEHHYTLQQNIQPSFQQSLARSRNAVSSVQQAQEPTQSAAHTDMVAAVVQQNAYLQLLSRMVVQTLCRNQMAIWSRTYCKILAKKAVQCLCNRDGHIWLLSMATLQLQNDNREIVRQLQRLISADARACHGSAVQSQRHGTSSSPARHAVQGAPESHNRENSLDDILRAQSQRFLQTKVARGQLVKEIQERCVQRERMVQKRAELQQFIEYHRNIQKLGGLQDEVYSLRQQALQLKGIKAKLQLEREKNTTLKSALLREQYINQIALSQITHLDDELYKAQRCQDATSHEFDLVMAKSIAIDKHKYNSMMSQLECLQRAACAQRSQIVVSTTELEALSGADLRLSVLQETLKTHTAVDTTELRVLQQKADTADMVLSMAHECEVRSAKLQDIINSQHDCACGKKELLARMKEQINNAEEEIAQWAEVGSFYNMETQDLIASLFQQVEDIKQVLQQAKAAVGQLSPPLHCSATLNRVLINFDTRSKVTAIVTKSKTTIRYGDKTRLDYHPFLVERGEAFVTPKLNDEVGEGQRRISIFRGHFLLDPKHFGQYYGIVLRGRGFDNIILDDELFNLHNDTLVRELCDEAGDRCGVGCYSVYYACQMQQKNIALIKINPDLCYYSLIHDSRLFYSTFRVRSGIPENDTACVKGLMAQVAADLNMASYLCIPTQKVGYNDEL